MRPPDGRPDAREDASASLDGLIAMLQSVSGETRAARAVAIDHLDRWLARGYVPPEQASAEARLIIASRWMLNDRPDHPVIPVWAARASQVLQEIDDQPLAALLASFAFDHAIRVGDFGAAGRLVAEMWDRTASSDEARGNWLPSAALFLWLSGRSEAALSALQPALEQSTLPPALRHALLEQAASAALAFGDAARCIHYLDRAAEVADAMSPHNLAHLWFLHAGAALVSGDAARASDAIGRCEAHARDVEARFFNALWRLGAAVIHIEADQARRAERELSELLGDVVLMRARYLEWSVRLARAAARLALHRRPASEADLAAALGIAAQNGYVNCDPWGVTPALRTLLGFAAERRIEPRAARAILAQHAP